MVPPDGLSDAAATGAAGCEVLIKGNGCNDIGAPNASMPPPMFPPNMPLLGPGGG